MERNDAIKQIRTALRKRSGKAWSVCGGRGTAWGWIRICSPPARLVDGYMVDEERSELAQLLGLDSVHFQGENIMASGDARIEYVDRANGRTPSRIGVPYWD